LDINDNPMYTEIIIEDNGDGINQNDLPHIFERFYKGTNSDNKSVGIGLALSKMIIENQNGTIYVENIYPGVKFTIHFYKEVI
ncbi:MAG: sensor histidine kinase, partial [Coprobacillus sp.]